MAKKTSLLLADDRAEDYEITEIASPSRQSAMPRKCSLQEGKKCSCYPAVAPDVAMSEAAVEGNLVMGPAWPARPAWLAKFLTVLGTEFAP
jgi:protease I